VTSGVGQSRRLARKRAPIPSRPRAGAVRIASLSSALLIVGCLIVACSTPVPPTVTLGPVVPVDRSAVLFVMAESQRSRIVESLRHAGLRPADEPSETGLRLWVRLGGRRGGARCGGIHNVAYVLSEREMRVAVIKGRGSTGTCEPNIFDAMSQRLADLTVGD